MIFAMKTILSYFEVKKDRILSDYLYLISIPLIWNFASAKHIHKIPADLVGYFITIHSIVTFFDPLVDLIVKHDEVYDGEMTDMLMNILHETDPEISNKIMEVL